MHILFLTSILLKSFSSNEMLMYWDSIDSTIQLDALLIQASVRYKISWEAFYDLNLWFITVFSTKLKQTGANSISPLSLYFFNKTVYSIRYLKPFVSFKKSLNKSLILDLITSTFLSIISTFYSIAYSLNTWFVFIKLSYS